MEDIVTRLRKKYGGQLPICIEAADEIERLQHNCKHLEAEIARLERLAQ